MITGHLLYKYRHLVENAFGSIKQYRGIVTRYEKFERNADYKMEPVAPVKSLAQWYRVTPCMFVLSLCWGGSFFTKLRL